MPFTSSVFVVSRSFWLPYPCTPTEYAAFKEATILAEHLSTCRLHPTFILAFVYNCAGLRQETSTKNDESLPASD